jgi:short-subunit dehydrogenase
VIIASRNLQELNRVKSECSDPSRVMVMQMDLSDPEKCLKQAKEYALTERIDILVNNGGVSQRDEFKNTEWKVVQWMMNVNTLAPIALIKGFQNLFEKNKET